MSSTEAGSLRPNYAWEQMEELHWLQFPVEEPGYAVGNLSEDYMARQVGTADSLG